MYLLKSRNLKFSTTGSTLSETAPCQNNETESGKNVNKLDSETTWTASSIKKLIEFRREMDLQFQSPSCKKIKLWGRISQNLKNEGINVTAIEADRKWRNLMLTYRRRKDQMKRSGGGQVPFWEFQEELDTFLASKANINPPPDTLLSSLSSATKENDAEEIGDACTSDDCLENKQAPPTKKRKRTCSSKDEPPKWFQEYIKKQEAADEQRWKKLEEIEVEKLNILKNILNIVQKNKEKK
ncbi:uncharacterized protein [Centruroides vittatus]|uniref:uncharacterized protein n=1 Tax=Centruroides vittatus TaxID=120091 RepID=UPI0035106CBD